MTLIETLRSSMASVKVKSPMVQRTVKVSGSLHFYGKVDGAMVATVLFCISVETFLPIFTGLFSFSFFSRVNKSFKNLAYFGICLMASKRGMLTSTLLKVSRRSKSSSTFFARMDLDGTGDPQVCARSWDSIYSLVLSSHTYRRSFWSSADR